MTDESAVLTDAQLAVLYTKARERGARLAAEIAAHDPPMAPFASWPGCWQFDVIGRCAKCREVEEIGEFYVRLEPWPAPSLASSKGMYCRTCMLLMGVGSDSTVAQALS